MKIKLETLMAGPGGILRPGVHDLPDAQAKALVEAGHASRVADSPLAAKVETATARAATENAQAAARPTPARAAAK